MLKTKNENNVKYKALLFCIRLPFVPFGVHHVKKYQCTLYFLYFKCFHDKMNISSCLKGVKHAAYGPTGLNTRPEHKMKLLC